MLHSLSFKESENSKLPSLYLSKCQHYSNTHPLFSYFCGMYCVQTALALLDDKDHEHVLISLLEYLENLKKGRTMKSLTSSIMLRLEFSRQLDKKYQQLTSIIHLVKETTVNFEQYVELLFELAFLYGVLRGLYPESDFALDEEKADLEKEGSDLEIEYRIHYCKTQASTVVNLLRQGQNPNDYIDQLRLVPTSRDEGYGDEISKSQVDDMLKQVMEMPDEAFEVDDGEEQEEEKEEFGEGELHKPLPLKRSAHELPSVPVGESSTDKKSPEPEQKANSKNTPKAQPSTDVPDKNIPVYHTTKHANYSMKEIQTIIENENYIELAQKEARHAVSALNYEDCDTALLKLEEAIRLIQEFKIRNIQ